MGYATSRVTGLNTGGRMLQEKAAPEAVRLPAGLLHVRQLAYELSRLGPTAPRNLRVVVTVPTLRLSGVAAALGAVLTSGTRCEDCPHRQLAPGARVTGWVSGRFVDSTLSTITDDLLRFGGITLRGNRDQVHRLPDDFPERRHGRLPEDVRTDVAAALGCTEANAGQRLSAVSAHPVVVAGEPSVFRGDVEELAEASSSLHLRGRLYAGSHLHDWFRHPVLLMGAVPEPEHVPWAQQLRPRLVIITGSAGWVGSSRRNWPDVPILVLLPRRSPASCDVARLICASGWAALSAVPPPLAQLLRPAAGIEVLCRVEPEAGADDEDLW